MAVSRSLLRFLPSSRQALTQPALHRFTPRIQLAVQPSAWGFRSMSSSASSGVIGLPEDLARKRWVQTPEDEVKFQEYERNAIIANSTNIQDLVRDIPEEDWKIGTSIMYEKNAPFRRNFEELGFQFVYEEQVPAHQVGDKIFRPLRFKSRLDVHLHKLAPTPTQLAILKEVLGPRYVERGSNRYMRLVSRNLPTAEANKHRVFDWAIYLLHESARLAQEWAPKEWAAWEPKRQKAQAEHEAFVNSIKEERKEIVDQHAVEDEITAKTRAASDIISDPGETGYLTPEEFMNFVEEFQKQFADLGVTLQTDDGEVPMKAIARTILEQEPNLTVDEVVDRMVAMMQDAQLQDQGGVLSPSSKGGISFE